MAWSAPAVCARPAPGAPPAMQRRRGRRAARRAHFFMHAIEVKSAWTLAVTQGSYRHACEVAQLPDGACPARPRPAVTAEHHLETPSLARVPAAVRRDGEHPHALGLDRAHKGVCAACRLIWRQSWLLLHRFA